MTTTQRIALEVAAIFLMATAFVFGSLASAPADYGLALVTAKWLGLIPGVAAIILRFIPAPQDLHQ